MPRWKLTVILTFLRDCAQDPRYQFLPSVRMIFANADPSRYAASLVSRMPSPMEDFTPTSVLDSDTLTLVSSLPRGVAGTYAYAYALLAGLFGVYIGMSGCLLTRQEGHESSRATGNTLHYRLSAGATAVKHVVKLPQILRQELSPSSRVLWLFHTETRVFQAALVPSDASATAAEVSPTEWHDVPHTQLSRLLANRICEFVGLPPSGEEALPRASITLQQQAGRYTSEFLTSIAVLACNADLRPCTTILSGG